jgi:hypothetical protein
MRFARYYFFYRVASRHAYRFAQQCRSRWYSVLLKRPQNFLLALSTAGFSFHNSGISDEELNSSVVSDPTTLSEANGQWEHIYTDKNIQVFRRVLNDKGGIFEYRCTGSYYDISPRKFADAQFDDKFRSQWDENVIVLETVEEDNETDSQVVKWLARYPYPLNPRLYIYVRRRTCDKAKQRITIISKGLSPKEYPDSSSHIRVTKYYSKLIVNAHSTLDKPGLDYTLVYYDDPKTSIPTLAYRWITKFGGPDFMRKIYKAAKELEDKN